MIEHLLSEIPRFFTASNVAFLAAAAGRTLLLSVARQDADDAQLGHPSGNGDAHAHH